MTDTSYVMIINPAELSREGLRRIVATEFNVAWASDAPAPGPLPGADPAICPLVIICAEPALARQHVTDVRRHHPDARIALLTEGAWQSHDVMAFYRSGVLAVIPKAASYQSFISTLRLVRDGSMVWPDGAHPTLGAEADAAEDLAEVAEEPVENVAPVVSHSTARAPDLDLRTGETDRSHKFSPREVGVLTGLREGHTNKEIARGLGITEATVKVHVKAILRKTRVRNRTQVALWASKTMVAAAHQPAAF